MYAICTDWTDYLDKGWVNVGRDLIVENCSHKTQDKDETNMRYSGFCDECGWDNDSGEPMKGFRYPLETKPSNEKILEVLNRTNCTVMYCDETDEYSLALCGVGMDLSQDIALAYIILERWIPFDLACVVQKGLSVSGKDWSILKKGIMDSLKRGRERSVELLKEWRAAKK